MSKRLGGIIGCKYKTSSSSIRCVFLEMAIFHTGGVFSYLPHHLDLALEDSVGHMHECVGASQGYHGVVGGFLAVGQVWILPHRCGDSAVPVAAPRQDRLGCTIDPMIALRRANTLMHVL